MVGMPACARNVNFPCFDIDKEQHKEYFWPERCEDLFGEEIAGPKGVEMSFDKAVPAVPHRKGRGKSFMVRGLR